MDKSLEENSKLKQENPGLTLEELRFKRAVTLVRLEVHKDIMQQKYRMPFSLNGKKSFSKIGYLTTGFKFARLAFRLWSSWRHK